VFDVLDDSGPSRIVADVGEKVDAASQPRQTDRHVERAATDVLAGHLSVLLDDVDQRLTDHQCTSRAAGRGHGVSFRSKVSNVARAPSVCSDSSAHRYASTNL
jgi:hypothetical protein